MRVVSIGAALFIAGAAASGPQSVHVPVMPSELPAVFSHFQFIGRDADGFPLYTEYGVPESQALMEGGILSIEGYDDGGVPIWTIVMAQPEGPMTSGQDVPSSSGDRGQPLRAQNVSAGNVTLPAAQALYAKALNEAQKRGLR